MDLIKFMDKSNHYFTYIFQKKSYALRGKKHALAPTKNR
jgi:hypothetical protein